ncbi:unnamed protein product [Umbelopsis vinacea]
MSSGATVGSANESKRSLLYVAAEAGHTRIVELALAEQDKFKTTTHAKEMALFKAAQLGRTDIVNLLLKSGVGVETTDEKGWTALHVASNCSKTEVVLAMLETGNGFNIDYKEKTAWWTPLFVAKQPEVISLLLAYGANVDARDKDGNSVLLHYVQHNNLHGVHLLLNHGCDIQAVNFDGSTALSCALDKRCWAIMDMLLKRGCDPFVPSELIVDAHNISNSGEKVEALERLFARHAEMGFSPSMMQDEFVFSDALCEVDFEFYTESHSEYKDSIKNHQNA